MSVTIPPATSKNTTARDAPTATPVVLEEGVELDIEMNDLHRRCQLPLKDKPVTSLLFVK